MPGGTQLFAAGVGAAVGLAALAALIVVGRSRARRRAGEAVASRREGGALAKRGGGAGKGDFAQANPLAVARGRTAPRPPKGAAPTHSRLSFAQFHRAAGGE
jgi:hypothetical protein